MPICNSPFNCDFTVLTPETILRNLLVEDSQGCAAIRIIETDDLGPYIDCDNINQGWLPLIMQLISVDGNGDWAVRVYKTS
jgi:hypothetical protein